MHYGGYMSKNDPARNAGIPTWLRQYAARHGVTVDEIIRVRKQNPAPMLDHWRDRIAKAKA